VKESSASIKQRVHQLLIGSGILLLVGGYIQFFLFPSLRGLIYFGWDEHFYRMFGTFLDPNFFGLFLALFFLYVVAQLFRLKITSKKWTFAFFFSLATAIFIAIFLTYSRTALLALSCGVFILFWSKQFWKWIAILLVAGVLTAYLVFPVIQKQAQGNNIFRTTSTDARLGSAKNAVIIFMDNPIIGIGFNAYRYSVYRHHFQPGVSMQEDHGASGADSSLLLVLATSGIIGLFFFLLYFLSHFKILLFAKKREGLAILIALFVGSIFVNGLFYPSLLVWVWIVLGITENV
jgi:O-antigen ligase